MPRLSQDFVATLAPVTTDVWHWDDTLKGFAVRQRPGAEPQWWVRYTIEGKKRKHLIGPCEVVKAKKARERARDVLEAARLGKDTNEERRETRSAPTVADLAREHQLLHKPPLIAEDTFKDRKTHWDKHIVPALGKIRVRDLSRSDVLKFHLSYASQPSLANRLVATLSKALNDCMTFRPAWRPDNPAARIEKFEETKRTRILSVEEIGRLMKRLDQLERGNMSWWGAPWLFHALMLSGLRLSELSKRTWDQIDLDEGTLFIPRTKAKKPRTVVLSQDMIDLLRRMPRRSKWVFPNSDGSWFKCPQHHWDAIRDECGIKDVRLHDLRHTVASYAMHAGGLSQREVMELLGHSQMSTTERYLNVHDEAKRGISNRASAAIASVVSYQGCD